MRRIRLSKRVVAACAVLVALAIAGGVGRYVVSRPARLHTVFTLPTGPRFATCGLFAPNDVCYVVGACATKGVSDVGVATWDGEKVRTLSTLAGASSRVTSIAASPDGEVIASGHADGTVRLCLASNHEIIASLENPGGRVDAIAFSPNGSEVVFAVNYGVGLEAKSSLTALCVADGSTVSIEELDDEVKCIAFSPKGSLMARGAADGSIKIWDTTSWTELTRISAHPGAVLSLQFSPDGKVLASAFWDVRLWDIETNQCKQTLAHRNEAVHALAFSPDGRSLASGETHAEYDWDFDWSTGYLPTPSLRCKGGGRVSIWNLATGKRIAESEHTVGCVHTFAFAPDGNLLKSIDGAGIVTFWDTAR